MTRSQRSRTASIAAILLVASLGIGLVGGFLISRGTESQGADIASLSISAKEQFIVLVSTAYAREGDLERAQAQLARLDAPNVKQWLASLTDRYIAEGHDPAEIRALVSLAQALDATSPQISAWLAAAATPTPTAVPPTATATHTTAPTASPLPPTSLPPTATAAIQPTEPVPTATAIPPTATAVPPTAAPPTATARPRPTNTPPPPTEPPTPTWNWTARLVGPGQEGQECDGGGKKLIRVTVLDAAGNQVPSVWVYENYTGLYQVTGHKADDPYWGPGEVEFSALDGGRVCIASGEGGSCDSDVTRDLPCHDTPPIDDLYAAGYCDCCEAGITKERCQELVESGSCLGAGWYYWRVEFQRSR